MNKRRQVFENTLWAIIQIREKETLGKRVLEDLCVLEAQHLTCKLVMGRFRCFLFTNSSLKNKLYLKGDMMKTPLKYLCMSLIFSLIFVVSWAAVSDYSFSSSVYQCTGASWIERIMCFLPVSFSAFL